MYKFVVVALAFATAAIADSTFMKSSVLPLHTPLAYSAGLYPQYSQYAQYYPQYAQYGGLNAIPYAAYHQGAYGAMPYSAAMPASYMSAYPLHQQAMYQKSAIIAAAPAAYPYSGYPLASSTFVKRSVESKEDKKIPA